MAEINLKALLAEIRDELEALDHEREQSQRPPLFDLQTFELELKFAVATEGKTSGGLDLKIISLGDTESVRSESIQTIRLSYRVAQSSAKQKPLGSRLHASAQGESPSHGIDIVE